MGTLSVDPWVHPQAGGFFWLRELSHAGDSPVMRAAAWRLLARLAGPDAADMRPLFFQGWPAAVRTALQVLPSSAMRLPAQLGCLHCMCVRDSAYKRVQRLPRFALWQNLLLQDRATLAAGRPGMAHPGNGLLACH